MRVDHRGHLDLLLLTALEPGPAHGYAIIERIRHRSQGVFDLAEGTVYPALHRLEGEGLLQSRWSDEAQRPRRVYSLTRRGRAAVGERTQSWLRFAQGMAAALEGPA